MNTEQAVGQIPDPGVLEKVIAAFVQAVTSPAAPALLAAILGHFVIDVIKDMREASGKPYWRPAAVRLLSVVVTQALFIMTWAVMLYFKRKSNPAATWGELDFLYGIAGSLASIAWHHFQEWRNPPRPSEDPK